MIRLLGNICTKKDRILKLQTTKRIQLYNKSISKDLRYKDTVKTEILFLHTIETCEKIKYTTKKKLNVGMNRNYIKSTDI